MTVGYERARGIRAVHEQADGFSFSVSKTFPVPAEQLFDAFVTEAARDRWLEPGTLRLRTALPHRSARFDVLSHGTRLEVYLTSKGEANTTVTIQHTKLLTSEEVAPWRAFWKERLNRLAAQLSGGTLHLE